MDLSFYFDKFSPRSAYFVLLSYQKILQEVRIEFFNKFLSPVRRPRELHDVYSSLECKNVFKVLRIQATTKGWYYLQ